MGYSARTLDVVGRVVLFPRNHAARLAAVYCRARSRGAGGGGVVGVYARHWPIDAAQLASMARFRDHWVPR